MSAPVYRTEELDDGAISLVCHEKSLDSEADCRDVADGIGFSLRRDPAQPQPVRIGVGRLEPTQFVDERMQLVDRAAKLLPERSDFAELPVESESLERRDERERVTEMKRETDQAS